jgi:hypothetical protein
VVRFTPGPLYHPRLIACTEDEVSIVQSIYAIYPFSYTLIYLSYVEQIVPLSLVGKCEELLERKVAAPV